MHKIKNRKEEVIMSETMADFEKELESSFRKLNEGIWWKV